MFGAGGSLGFAWTVGALTAAQEAWGWDVRDVDVVVGTSAGSIVAGVTGAGVDAAVLVRHVSGSPAHDDPVVQWDYDSDGGGVLPPPPRFGVGSPRLLVETLRHPRRMPPIAAFGALLPHGRGNLLPVGRMVGRLAGDEWPRRDTWIVSFDYDRGRRTVFGRDGSPQATLADAVMASCAIPGWFAPVGIEGRRYVDGGMYSTTSADLLVGGGLDEVVVIAPMVSVDYDRPRGALVRLERRFRRMISRRTLAELERVRASGIAVRLVCPGPEELQAMGPNLMDHRRRTQVLTTTLRVQRAQLRSEVGSP